MEITLEELNLSGADATVLQEWPAGASVSQGVVGDGWVVLSGMRPASAARRGVPAIALRRSLWATM